MPTVLITGANRGIGLAFVRQYATDGWRVIATCRNPIGLGELATVPGNVEVHGLDVSDHRQIERLAGELAEVELDVLINNAGVFGPRQNDIASLDYRAWEEVMRINAMSPLKIAEAFSGHLQSAGGGTLATLSSKMGSIAENSSGGDYIYRSSKAAVNAVMRTLHLEFGDRGVIVALLHPGSVETDMNPNALIGPSESVAGMRRVIAGLSAADSGGFFSYDGAEIPW